MSTFKPVLRFMVSSDIHYKDEPTVERERFERAIRFSYNYSASHPSYTGLDAFVIVGDFANNGSDKQMTAMKESLDKEIGDKAPVIMTLASHEFSDKNGGETAALERFDRIFGKTPDTHAVIGGFHFIALTCTNGCRFDYKKKMWCAQELKKAAQDDPKKPIFFFQHPHISETVYGSHNWGEDDLTAILMNYPQIIDFSGHSHAPINDPRSIHQEHFTCLGTGSMSYFELDEFDKVYGTIPPLDEECAQMLIVEADEKGRVRVHPVDVLTEQFFSSPWEIDEPWNPESFKYTHERYLNPVTPYFDEGAEAGISKIEENKITLFFPQAKCEKERVNCYYITVKTLDGIIVKQVGIWSMYYLSNMPESIIQEIEGLEPKTAYTLEIRAEGFWKNRSSNKLTVSFETK